MKAGTNELVDKFDGLAVERAQREERGESRLDPNHVPLSRVLKATKHYEIQVCSAKLPYYPRLASPRPLASPRLALSPRLASPRPLPLASPRLALFPSPRLSPRPLPLASPRLALLPGLALLPLLALLPRLASPRPLTLASPRLTNSPFRPLVQALRNARIPANGFNALVVTIIDGKAQDSMVPDVFALWPEWQEKYAKRWGTAEGAHTEGEQGVPECYPEPHLADGSSLFNAPCMKAAAAAAVSASGKSTFVDVVVGLQPIKSEDFPYFPIDDNDVRDDTSTSTRCACSSPEMSKPLKSSWPPPPPPPRSSSTISVTQPCEGAMRAIRQGGRLRRRMKRTRRTRRTSS